MSVYPIVKLPRKIKQAYEAQPSAVFSTPLAIKTSKLKPPRRFNTELLLTEALLLTVMAGGLTFYVSWIAGILLWLIGIALILAQASEMDGSYAQRWREYRDQMDRLQRQQWEAEFERTRWARLQTPEGVAQYRRQKIHEQLVASMPAQPGGEDLNVTDRRLALTLQEYFPDQLSLGQGSGLMLIDTASGLHISVIIDDRPQLVAGVASGSFLEDDLYLDRNWVVVRFTAEQVNQAVDSCCKALAEICAELLQAPEWLRPFSQVPDLWALPKNHGVA
jgi:hypothetical protein